jgi:hypothetical protein
MKKVIKRYLNENIGKNPIEEVFENNPELSNIGNVEQYSKYVNTIFPNSKVKNVVYHSTNNDIEGDYLRPSKEGVYGAGIYVQTSRDYAYFYGSNILSLVINTKSPFRFFKENGEKNDLFSKILGKWEKTKKFYYAEAAKEEFQDELKKNGFDSIKTTETGDYSYYILFEPEQAHILGSKKDIEGFKKYLDELRNNYINESIGMKKIVKLTELDITRLVKKVLFEQETEQSNYMFFSNLKQMKRQIEMIMEMDPNMIDEIIQNGHDWADDHISEAKTNMDQVFDFLKNEMDEESQYENSEGVNEGRKKTGTPLCARGKASAKAKYDVYPSAYSNGHAVQVCKGKIKGLDGKKHCSGAYC